MLRLTNLKHGTLTEPEFAQLAALLIKAGYTVRRKKEKPPDKPNATAVWAVEYEAK